MKLIKPSQNLPSQNQQHSVIQDVNLLKETSKINHNSHLPVQESSENEDTEMKENNTEESNINHNQDYHHLAQIL